MFSFLKKATAVLLLVLLISAQSVMASGKMEVKIGDYVDFVGESSQSSPIYKWVVKKGDEIMSTQSARNFSYQFNQQGEYVVNLTATSGSVVENTTIHVLSGERYSRLSVDEDEGGEVVIPGVMPLRLHLLTLPPKDAENKITLLGDGKVQFLLSNSTGEILEYRIDKNVFVDSDGNGTANDDIDNSGDDSYLTGGAWTAEYKQDESTKIAAEVTLVSKDGKKAKEQVEIIFKEHRTTGDPVAIWEILPAPDSDDSLVHLYADPHTVSFYPRPSEGKILEYRIDTNIFVDSDGDGDPGNDIDNLNDISFKTGDVFEIEYDKTDGQIIAQLIVVGEGGKGSRIQKGFVFGEKPLPILTLKDIDTGGIRLTADKDFVVKGDPITFTVAGLQLALDQYTFEWDLDGDGETDKETEGVNTVNHIYEFPGALEVKVSIVDQEENVAEYSLAIVVKDAEVTKADFGFEINGNTVTFTNRSTITMNLASKSLDYMWSFGDTDPDSYEEQKNQIGEENPVYTYKKSGKYLVTLNITDADQVTDSKSAEVEIFQDYTGLEEGDELVTDGEIPSEAGESPLFVKILKFLLYLILIVVALIVLIVSGALIFFKIQQPELTFEELIDELKTKLLMKMGVHEMGDVPPFKEEGVEASPVQGTTIEPATEGSAEPTEPATSIGEGEGKMPPWMQKKPSSAEAPSDRDVIEGEVEESSLPASTPSEGELADETTENTEGEDHNPRTKEYTEDKTTDEPTAGQTGPSSDKSSDEEKGSAPDWMKDV